MTTPRTQEHRHWIQVEVPSDAGNTAFFHLDLNMVDMVSYVRQGVSENFEDILQTTITYAGVLKPIILKKDDAVYFAREWDKFIGGPKAKAPIAKPSVIHRVGAGNNGVVLK
jgi:hypothetical protein